MQRGNRIKHIYTPPAASRKWTLIQFALFTDHVERIAGVQNLTTKYENLSAHFVSILIGAYNPIVNISTRLPPIYLQHGRGVISPRTTSTTSIVAVWDPFCKDFV